MQLWEKVEGKGLKEGDDGLEKCHYPTLLIT